MEEKVCRFCQCFKDEDEKRRRKQMRKDAAEISLECKDHLHNWEKWLKERKNITEKLSKRLKRPKCHLLMNSFEENRKIFEERILFDNRRNYVYFDKYRGHPEWWKVVPRLYQCHLDIPIIEPTLTYSERKEMAPIVYIDTPLHILEEKNLLPRARNMFTRWQKGPYRQAIFYKIHTKMRFLEPHRPDCSNLIITGKRIEPKVPPVTEADTEKSDVSQKEENIFELAQTETKDESSKGVQIHVNEIPSIKFIINGTEISSSVMQQGTMKVRILFTTDEIPETPLQEKLVFANRGQKTLRIYFKEFEKFITFRDIITRVRKPSPFFFNKQELILLPGNDVKLPIWFRPTTSGHFIETWKITTSPVFWQEPFKLMVVIQGIAYQENFNKKIISIHKKLETNMRTTMIKEVVDDIYDAMKYQSKESTAYTYTERDIFEAMNMENWGVTKKPKYSYNRDVVRKLTKLYYNVRSPEDPPSWDYSIRTLKEATRKRDVLDFVKNLYKECRRIKERAKVLREMYDIPQDPSREKSEVPLPTKSAGKIKSEGKIKAEEPAHKNPPDLPTSYQITYSNFETLNMLLAELKQSMMIPNRDREKYATVYFIWRYYLSKIFSALGDYGGSNIDCLTKWEVTNNEDLPERLVFERFSDIWIKRTRRDKPKTRNTRTSVVAKPRPDWMTEIPKDDIGLAFTTYFRRMSTDKKKDKQKEAPKVQPNIGKPSSKSSEKKAAKSGSNAAYEILEDFDPYADVPMEFIREVPISESWQEVSMYSAQTGRSSVAATTPPPKTYEEKYILVYTKLCQAVDAMVSALETAKENIIHIPTLSELATNKVINVQAAYRRVPSPSDSADSIDTTDEYYQYLFDTYLKDPKTQDYFIKGKTLRIIEKLKEYYDSASVVSLARSWKSQEFLVFDSEVQQINKSAAAQTSETDIPYKPISNILLGEGGVASTTSLEVMGEGYEDKSSQVFYFVDSKQFIPEFSTIKEETSLDDW